MMFLHSENGKTYFQTPWYQAHFMVKLAQIQDDMRVLEPSAGEGRIANIIREQHPFSEIVVLDSSRKSCKVLRELGYETVIEGDFLDYSPKEKFDRVIMNPPFESGLDAKHIRHAYSLLRDSGRLIAIVSQKTLDGIVFREWVDNNKGMWISNPPFTFYANGVDIATVTVVMNK